VDIVHTVIIPDGLLGGSSDPEVTGTRFIVEHNSVISFTSDTARVAEKVQSVLNEVYGPIEIMVQISRSAAIVGERGRNPPRTKIEVFHATQILALYTPNQAVSEPFGHSGLERVRVLREPFNEYLRSVLLYSARVN
jgi:hypothetical protein